MIVYKIENLINGKIYIGITKFSLRKRFLEHQSPKRRGKSIIKDAILKYGVKNFKSEIIDTAISRAELREKEKFWIQKLDTCNPLIGYNIKSGGEGSERKRKYFLSDKHRQNLSKSRVGLKSHTTPHTEETKTLIRNQINERLSNNLFSPTRYNSKLIICLSTNQIFWSIEEAARRTNTFPQNILKCCKHLRKSTGGLTFEFFTNE